MSTLKEAELFSNYESLAKVHIYLEEQEDTLTVIPKTYQRFILFSPEETLKLTYEHNLNQFVFHILFKELKVINQNKFYYIFTILKTEHVINNKRNYLPTADSRALFSSSSQYGYVHILEHKPQLFHIVSDEKIEERYLDIFYNENKKKKRVSGKLIWSKKSMNTYFYGFQF